MKNLKPKITVNQDCFYEGLFNYSSGKMKAKTAALAIELMLSNHLAEHLSNDFRELTRIFATNLRDNYLRLMEEEVSKMTEEEKTEIFNYLD